MRRLPDDVRAKVRPIPADFTAPMDLENSNRALVWRAELSTPQGPLKVVYAARLKGPGELQMREAAGDVRAMAWRATELARLGYVDHLTHIRTDRHRARPGAGRPLTPEAQSFLREVREAHDQRIADLARPPAPSTAHLEA